MVGFVFTACQQLASGFTAAAGFAMFARSARAAWTKLAARLGRAPGDWTQSSWITRAIVVFTLGTTAVVLVQLATTGEVGVRRHRRAIVQAALLCALMVGAVAAVAATMADIGRRVSWMQSPTDGILRVLGNPLFWVGVVLIVALIGRSGKQHDAVDPL